MRWLFPGIGVKRWIGVLILGIAMVSIGIGYLLVTVYRNAPLPEVFYWLTLQFVDRWIRGILFIGFGVALTVFSIIQINRSLLSPFLQDTGDDRLVDILYRQRVLSNAPTIVCIGGGPGLSIVLRGLRNVTANLWGITLGHGPARTRSELGLLQNRVLQATHDDVIVEAETRDGTHLEGAQIMNRRSGEPIICVDVHKADNGAPVANREAVQIILASDAIVIGPGDLWGSVIPSLLVPDVADAIRLSKAKKIFVCNIMTQAGRTNSYSVADHVRAVQNAANIQIDYILVNHRRPNEKLLANYLEMKQSEVVFDPKAGGDLSQVTFASTSDKFVLVEGAFMVEADLTTDMREEVLIDREGRDVHRSLTVIRHDPEKLGASIGELIQSESWRLPAA